MMKFEVRIMANPTLGDYQVEEDVVAFPGDA